MVLTREEREDLLSKRDTIISRIESLEGEMEEGTLSQGQVHETLVKEFGSDYWLQVETADKKLREETRRKNMVVAAAISFLFALPLLVILDPAGITGFGTIEIEQPTSIGLAQTFTDNTIFQTGILTDITSLRADGFYTGKKGFRLEHIDGNNNKQLLLAYEPSQIPKDAVILGEETLGAVAELPTKQLSFSGQCEDTCSLDSPGPHQVQITIHDGSIYLDSLTFTKTVLVEEAPNPGEVIETIIDEPEEPVIEEPVVEKPVETPEPDNTLLSDGTVCSTNIECSSGSCHDNIYEGTTTQKRCSPINNCVNNEQNTYARGTSFEESTCYSSNEGSVWIANQGRYEIRGDNNKPVSIIDKYGNMIITGTTRTSPHSDDWTIKDTEGNTVISISSTGILTLPGSITERTTPNGDGLTITNEEGNTQVVLKRDGNIELTGDFLVASII